MPKDINLLPEEFRERDLKEKESVRKKPKVVKIEMSNPHEEKKGTDLKQPKPSLMSRLFSGHSGPPQSLPPRPEKVEQPKEASLEREEEKKLHIPKPEGKNNVAKVDMLSGGFLFGSKDAQPEPIPEAPEEVPVPPEEPEKNSEEEVILNTRRPEKEPKQHKEKQPLFLSFSKLFSKKNKPAKNKRARSKSREHGEVDVNLIPTELAGSPEENAGRKGFVLGMSVFVALLVVATAYLGITWYQLRIAREIRMFEEQILSYNAQIRELEQQRQAAIRLQDRLKHVDDLLGNHLYWTKFFEKLETYTIPDVFYTSFAMSGTENISLAAEARSYRAVAQQLVVLQQATDFVQSVDINAASANIDLETGETRSVIFIINLRLRPDVFLADKE